ncbi:WD repeat-containing protein 43 isoform X2 [Anastrepha obliqua]|uniref:WD repeat-containing protein 43 isoform X2 n=1 Tax=Anastrepha obliqua TaxID=95512 RepID=UPI00240A016D|nr:WD repeat-containing protein 43 isoform X2 [Anastrepha obliqua]
MALGSHHVLGFSPDAKLFAFINDQGILRIWDTDTNELKQEYTPNLQLSGPCTAFTWFIAGSVSGEPTEKKKARKLHAGSTKDEGAIYLALGTSNGNISLYSYALGKIERTLKGEGHSGKVTCLTQDDEGHLYSSGEDCQIIVWSVADEKQLSSWSVGTEKPYSIVYSKISKNLVVGGRQIKIFSTASQELMQTFTGHTSDINLMSFLELDESIEYVLSTSRMERIICLWKIGKKGRNKSATCTLLMEDVAHCLTSHVDNDRNLRVASVTRSGVIHVYLIAVENIKAEKPIKPKLTIEIASDSATVIAPIPAISVSLRHSAHPQELIFGYGNSSFLVFERLKPNFAEKLQVLIRADPKLLYLTQGKLSRKDGKSGGALKTLTPIVNEAKVDYKSTVTVSKKKLKAVEMPMESRLQNLNLNALPGGVAPQAQSKVQLLVQALHSKDNTLLRSVLHTHDTKTIQLTLHKLPVPYVGPLVNELTQFMQQKRMNVEYAVDWLKILVQTHSSQLMALGSEDLLNKFGPCIGIIEHRVNCLKELSKVAGRLDLLINQIKRNTDEDNLNSANVLVYEDNDSSDPELEDEGEKSSPDDEWDEDIEDTVENMEQDSEDNDESENENDDDSDADEGEEMDT